MTKNNSNDIKNVSIRKILDSRGNPTVEVDVITHGNGFGRTAAPSGASTGVHEVLAIPKEGIDYAIQNFQKRVAEKIVGYDITNQENIDRLLHNIDGTKNFSKIGGNIAIATSLSVVKAAANTLNLPLYRYLLDMVDGQLSSMPMPLGNVLGGGKHAIGGTDIQEYLVISFGPSVADSIFANAKVHKKVKEILQKKYPHISLGRGDEGAWVACVGNEEALEIVAQACKEISTNLGFDVKPSLDVAASELYKNGKYYYKEQTLDVDAQIDFIKGLIDKYGLYIVEDPLEEDDFKGYARLTKMVGEKYLIVGDDLFVTNSKRLEKGISMGAANAILIKPNQIGTLTDTIRTVKLAHEKGYKTIISHRSGETTDNTIAHLGVALNCHAIKTGVVGGERIAKLNELIRIEEQILGEA